MPKRSCPDVLADLLEKFSTLMLETNTAFTPSPAVQAPPDVIPET